jgi:hypothetical protein
VFNWSYIKNNSGIYRFLDSKEIYFISKGGLVYLYIPEEQYKELADSSLYCDNKFIEANNEIR